MNAIELGLFDFSIFLLVYTYRISHVAMFMWFKYRCPCGHGYCYTLKFSSTLNLHPIHTFKHQSHKSQPWQTQPVHKGKCASHGYGHAGTSPTNPNASVTTTPRKDSYLGISPWRMPSTKSPGRHGSSLIYKKKRSGSRTSNASIAC